MSGPTQQTHAKQSQTKHQQGVGVGGRIEQRFKASFTLFFPLRTEQNLPTPNCRFHPLPFLPPLCKRLLIFNFPSINLLSQTKPRHHLASLSFCKASAFFQRHVNYVFGSDFHDERGKRKKGRVLRSQSQSQSQPSRNCSSGA